MEISQRFDLHDAEHAVQQLFDSRADILDSRDTQVSFYEYAAQNFSIERPDQVNWVNVERDGEIKTAVFQTQNNQIEISFD